MSKSADEAAQHRRAELVGGLASVRALIADACGAACRDPHSVTLVAVTKTYPALDVATLATLGVLDVGESRDQEAASKVAQTAALLHETMPLRWHFVGRLQSRKCRSVASYAFAVHSVDRHELVTGLADGVRRAERDPVEAFVQVSLDGDPDRGGVGEAGLAALADEVASSDQLLLRGVMAVAPLGADPGAAFAKLADISAALQTRHPQATSISAGMTADLESAIRHGSTHVRVGSALLGRRSPLLG